MVNVTVDTTGLLRWARVMDQIAMMTRPAVARALNAAGEDVVDRYARDVADDLDLDFGEVRSRIVVYQADASNPKWTMDASDVVLTGPQGKPWPSREGSAYDKGVLLDIIGYADCCELCEQIAADGPYTPTQINRFAAEWVNFVPAPPAPGRTRTNLLHPNCYCATRPFASHRRISATFGGRTYDTTPSSLGHHLAEQMATVITLAARSA